MIQLDDLRNATGAQLYGEIASVQFNNFCIRSEDANPGDLFVVGQGTPQMGKRHFTEAVRRGVTGILCDHPPDVDVSGITVLLVGDTVSAMGQWGAYILRSYNPTVICVAGITGKRTTQAAVARILEIDFEVYAPEVTESGRMGLALNLTDLDRHHEVVVLDLSPKYSGDLRELLAVAQPHISVLTNLDVESAEVEKPTLNLYHEIADLCEFAGRDGTIIVNNDDSLLSRLVENIQCNSLTYGKSVRPSDVWAQNIQYLLSHSEFDLQIRPHTYPQNVVSLLGAEGVYASLAAVSVGLVFDRFATRMLEELAKPFNLSGRMNRLSGIHNTTLIDNTSRVDPYSAADTLDWIEQLSTGIQHKKILVLGQLDITTLEYQRLGQRAASIVDTFIVQGEKVITAYKAARKAGLDRAQCHIVFRPDDTASLVKEVANPGDLIMLIGGNPVEMTQLVEELVATSSFQAQMRNISSENKILRSASDSWIEIKLNDVVKNLQTIKRRVGETVEILVVVSENAYGHGLLPIAQTVVLNGVGILGVSTFKTALTLREGGIDTDILLMGPIEQNDIYVAVLYDLTLSVTSPETADRILYVARSLERQVRVHLNIDTSLGRFGLPEDQVIPTFRKLVHSEHILIDGVYSELVMSDSLNGIAFSREQVALFKKMLVSVQAAGVTIPHIHIANSTAALSLPESLFNLVRIGISLYGLESSPEVPLPVTIQPVLAWKTKVLQINRLEAGSNIGYHGQYRAPNDELVAVIPVGYASGFRAQPRGWESVLINGKRAPLIGPSGMSYSFVNVTHIPDVYPGDEVVLLGSQGRERITAREVSRWLECSIYEMITSISQNVPRIMI